VLIVTGRLKSLIMQSHTNIQKTANLCVSDVFWKWSKGNLDEEEGTRMGRRQMRMACNNSHPV
jgi:hypothetical protein